MDDKKPEIYGAIEYDQYAFMRDAMEDIGLKKDLFVYQDGTGAKASIVANLGLLAATATPLGALTSIIAHGTSILDRFADDFMHYDVRLKNYISYSPNLNTVVPRLKAVLASLPAKEKIDVAETVEQLTDLHKRAGQITRENRLTAVVKLGTGVLTIAAMAVFPPAAVAIGLAGVAALNVESIVHNARKLQQGGSLNRIFNEVSQKVSEIATHYEPRNIPPVSYRSWGF